MTDRRKFLVTGAASASAAALTSCAVFDRRGWQSILGDAMGTGARPLPPLQPGDGEGIDEQWFIDFVADMVENDSTAEMEGKFTGEPLFRGSLVGFVSGADPMLEKYKRIIGPFHHTPEEVIEYAAAEQGVPSPPIEKTSVMCFALPLADDVVADNAAQKRWCSARWAQGRLLGEIFCQKLVDAMLEELAARGVLAVAPDLMPDFRKKRYPKVGWASPWSHRHMLFAAGLGSFGMNDFLITEMGATHRCGSIVVAMPLEPNRKRHPHHRHACIHHQTGECLECARRCPVGANSPDGHNKDRCGRNVLGNTPRNQIVNNVNAYGCGLCSTGTPCSRESPI